MNVMFASNGGLVELWVTKTDTYTSKTTGEEYANIQAIGPIPDGARGNAKGFEITEYSCEPSILPKVVFEGSPVFCKFKSVVRPNKDRFGNITNVQVLTELVEDAPAPRQAQQSRPAAPAADAAKS